MIFCFTGQPLSGKSTLTKILSKKTGITRIGTGDYARSIGMKSDERSITEHDLSLEMNDRINSLVVELMQVHRDSHLIIDGWPRSVEQSMMLKGSGHIYRVFWLSLHPMTMIERMMNRGRKGDLIEVVKSRLHSTIRLHSEIVRIFEDDLTMLNGDLDKKILEAEVFSCVDFLER